MQVIVRHTDLDLVRVSIDNLFGRNSIAAFVQSLPICFVSRQNYEDSVAALRHGELECVPLELNVASSYWEVSALTPTLRSMQS